MDLFGQNILDFPSNDGSFLFGDFPQVPDSPDLLNLDIESLLEERDLGGSTDLESFLTSAPQYKEEDAKPLENLTFEEIMTEGTVSSLSQETENSLDHQEFPDCKSMLDVFNQIDLTSVLNLWSDTSGASESNVPSSEDLEDIMDVEESIKVELGSPERGDPVQSNFGLEQEAGEDPDSGDFDLDLWSMYQGSEGTHQQNDDLLSSILSSEDIFDPEYFENVDIDSVDPTCTKEEEEEKGETSEDWYSTTPWVMRDHDYTSATLPARSSLFLTPPHSPGVSETKTCLKLLRKSLKKGNKTLQRVKFSQSKDQKFIINLPVKKETKVKARSILKKRTSLNDGASEREGQSQSQFAIKVLESSQERDFDKNRKKKSSSKTCPKLQTERELHNSMERQRRIQMNEAFENLKEVIPTIAHCKKTSKLLILTQAKDYCRGLDGKLARLEAIQWQEERRRSELSERLSLLQFQILN